MSAPLKIEVQGGNELRKTLRALGDTDLKRELSEAGKAAAEIVAGRARERVPVKTGRLRDAIRAGGTQRGGYVAFGKKSVPYAAPRSAHVSSFLGLKFLKSVLLTGLMAVAL